MNGINDRAREVLKINPTDAIVHRRCNDRRNRKKKKLNGTDSAHKWPFYYHNGMLMLKSITPAKMSSRKISLIAFMRHSPARCVTRSVIILATM